MVELLWKNMLICVAFENQNVKIKVYKPNCKSIYQSNLPKKHLHYINEFEETNYHYQLLLTETAQ